MINVIGLGAGTHCAVMMDALLLNREISIVGLLDNEERHWGTRIHGVTVLGGDQEISKLILQGITYGFIGVGGSNTTKLRTLLFNKAKTLGLTIINTIHHRHRQCRNIQYFILILLLLLLY